MSNISIDVNRACSPEGKAYAAMVARSGDATSSQMSKIIAYWGADVVAKWQSVDSTEYLIDDSKKENAVEEGKKNAADKTGYDGEKRGTTRAVTRAIGGGLAATGAVMLTVSSSGGLLGSTATKVMEKSANRIGTKIVGKEASATNVRNAGGKNLGARATVILCAAMLAMYLAKKPNKDTHAATQELYNAKEGGGLFVEGQNTLLATQDDLVAASEEVVALSEDSEKKNKESNVDIEEFKTLFDFYREQLNALLAKAEAAKNGGEPLTSDEKALLQKLAPLMGDLSDGITEIVDDTSEYVAENYEEMEGYEDRYNENAEMMNEVLGLLQYGAEFDEPARDAANIEAVGDLLSSASAIRAATILSCSGFWNIAFAALGYVSGAGLLMAANEQREFANDMTAEIDFRRTVEDIEVNTEDIYMEEVDNWVNSMGIVEDLEIEVPEDEDMEYADDETINSAIIGSGNSDGSSNPFVSPQTGSGGNTGTTSNPFTSTTNGTDGNAGTTGNGTGVNGDENGNNGSAETRGVSSGNRSSGANDLPLTSDPRYVNAMGNGSDWSEVMNGNISRKSDNDIVTDESGKVVLSSKYADAIKTVSNVEEGGWFSKNDIPKILEKVLGAPFDAKMIKDVKSGKQLDSEYATRILKTKSQKNAGTGENDNSETATTLAKRVIDFYWPIFEKASTDGWRTG